MRTQKEIVQMLNEKVRKLNNTELSDRKQFDNIYGQIVALKWALGIYE